MTTATTIRVEYPYLAFGPKVGQKNVLIYATDLGSAKRCAMMLFAPVAKKDLGLVHVHLVESADITPLTYSRT